MPVVTKERGEKDMTPNMMDKIPTRVAQTERQQYVMSLGVTIGGERYLLRVRGSRPWSDFSSSTEFAKAYGIDNTGNLSAALRSGRVEIRAEGSMERLKGSELKDIISELKTKGALTFTYEGRVYPVGEQRV